jgi:hypothetical protein
MRVSGTPQSPKPPQRTVELGFMSLRASEAEGRTLLISFRRTVDANVRAKSIDCWKTSAKPSNSVVELPTYLGAISGICSGCTETKGCGRHLEGRTT